MEAGLEITDPRPRMKRHNMLFPLELFDEIERFAGKLAGKFGRPVKTCEAVRLLCRAALDHEKRTE